MQSLWSSKLHNMLCGDFWLTGPDFFCTDFCTSCSRTCMHGAVMQSLWSSKLHNMLCWDFWLPGPNISHTEFCTSCTGPVSIAQLGNHFDLVTQYAEVRFRIEWPRFFIAWCGKLQKQRTPDSPGFSADGAQVLCPQHHAAGLLRFSSVWSGIYVLGKVQMLSTLSLRRGFLNITFETVPMFVWLMMALSRP